MGRAAVAVSCSGWFPMAKAVVGGLWIPSRYGPASSGQGYLFLASSGAMPTSSGSMRMRPQYSHTMTFLCILISIWR